MNRVLFIVAVLLAMAHPSLWADEIVTREYRLKHADAGNIIRVLNVLIKNTSGKRILGGQERRLVVTDDTESQSKIAQILPIIDQPTSHTTSNKISMEMISRASRYMKQQKQAEIAAAKGPSSTPASNPIAAQSGGGSFAKSYDKYSSTQPYASVYSSEDAKLKNQGRVLRDDYGIANVSGLVLKGIFKDADGNRLAYLYYGGVRYTAREGHLYDPNRLPLKGYTSRVLSDRVILTGPDRVPKEIKFLTTL